MRVSCTSLDFAGLRLGGDEEDRTPGLGVANAALSQLSYIPNLQKFRATIYYSLPQCQELVGERKRELLKKDNPVLPFNLDLTKQARFPYNRARIEGPQVLRNARLMDRSRMQSLRNNRFFNIK